MNHKFLALILSVFFFSGLIWGSNTVKAEKTAVVEKEPARDRRELSVILYNWIPNLEEYFNTMETDFETNNPEIDLVIISLPGYYDGLDKTEADVYEVDESGLRMLLYADRLQPLAVNEVPDPDDFFPICKDVAHIDGQWWGIPHWTCTNYMFYNKNDKELAGVETFSELENVIGGKNHPRGQGLLVDMMGIYRCRELYKDTLMDLYPDDPESVYKYLDENNINQEVLAIENRIIDMMDPGMGRNPQNDKIFDYLQRQFMYGNGRAFVYYSEALGYFQKIIKDAEGFGDTTLSMDDITVKAFVQSDNGRAAQPGYVDSFCLDKSLKGQKRADAIKYITWVTSREVVVKQIAPTPDFVRYLSPARLSIYVDPNLLNQAPLYEELQPIMKLARYYPPPADWDWAPGLEAKLEKILPTN
jgi:thiamine pyridinylase